MASSRISSSSGNALEQVRAQQEQAEGGHGHQLERHQVEEQRGRLRHEQRGAVDGRQQQRVDPALLALGGEQARHADHGRQQQRHPQHPDGQLAVQRVAVQAEVEQHEDGDA